jgi:hypothetical protein
MEVSVPLSERTNSHNLGTGCRSIQEVSESAISTESTKILTRLWPVAYCIVNLPHTAFLFPACAAITPFINKAFYTFCCKELLWEQNILWPEARTGKTCSEANGSAGFTENSVQKVS